jgi:hypothetical protein
MAQNRKIPSRMPLASFAILSIISSFIISTTALAGASQQIALTITRPSDSAILSMRIHNQTKNTQRCFNLVQQGTTNASVNPTTSSTPVGQNSLQFNVGSSYNLTDNLHIQIFTKVQCKGPVQKNITNSLSKLQGTSKTSLEDQTRSSKQAQDGLDLEQKGQQPS